MTTCLVSKMLKDTTKCRKKGSNEKCTSKDSTLPNKDKKGICNSMVNREGTINSKICRHRKNKIQTSTTLTLLIQMCCIPMNIRMRRLEEEPTLFMLILGSRGIKIF